jgi:hypothetical protein
METRRTLLLKAEEPKREREGESEESEPIERGVMG